MVETETLYKYIVEELKKLIDRVKIGGHFEIELPKELPKRSKAKRVV